jgi:nucleoside-diphosphate-sugar epimerase
MTINNKPKILIVGNLGYIGSELTPYLRKKYPSSQLIGFDIGYFSGCVFSPLEISDYLLDQQIYGDVRAFNFDCLNGVEHVIYLAAISNDPMGNIYANETREINALAAANIAKEAKLRGVKSFVFASSCSIYGAGGDQIRTENSDLNPLTAYAKSKVEAENLLKPLAESEFIVTCLRFATACGASPRLRLDLVLNDFIVNALVNKKIEILSDGTPWRPLIAVEDMCDALDWALLRLKEDGGIFLAINTGFDGWNFQIKDLAFSVRDVIPATEVTINSNAPADKRSYRVSFSRYRELSRKVVPKADIKQTIVKIINRVTEVRYSDKNFRESIYIRLNYLKKLSDRGCLNTNLQYINYKKI